MRSEKFPERSLKILPGLALAAGVAAAGFAVSGGLAVVWPFSRYLASPTLAAIILGLIVRNLISLPTIVESGISFGVKRVLRAGIVLLGLRTSVMVVLEAGASAAWIVACTITAALATALLLARLLGVTRSLAALIAAGTSICGISAILTAAPAVGAEEEETSYAVMIISVLGLSATVSYPYIAELVLRLDAMGAGLFIGTAVHDTAQVTATSLMHDQLWGLRTRSGSSVVDIALATKLLRNAFMILVIPVLSLLFRKRRLQTGGGPRIASAVPVFVLGYLAMAVVRTFGDLAFPSGFQVWRDVVHLGELAGTGLVAVAVTSVGLSTDFRRLRGYGIRPFAVGLLSALVVAILAAVLIRLFADPGGA